MLTPLKKIFGFSFFLLLTLTLQSSIIAKPALVAYYTNWSQYRPAPGTFTPENIAPIISQLSDINYAFFFFNYQSAVQPAGVTNDWKIHFSDGNDDANLKAVVAIANGHGVNVYATIGGWEFNSNDADSYGYLTYTFFSQMVADPTKYMPFTSSCITLCKQYGLAGIDLDWEFPGLEIQGGSAHDYQNFTDFMAYFSRQLHSQGLKVTAAIPSNAPGGFLAGTANIAVGDGLNAYVISPSNPQSYVDWLAGISQYFDAYNLMSYDYNAAGSGLLFTGENSPLLPLTPCAPCIVNSVNNLLTNHQFPAQSTPPSKIIVGLGAYGHSYGGVSFPSPLPGQPYGSGASFQGPGNPGECTGDAGILAYYEILGNLKTNFFQGSATNSITSAAYAWGINLKNWVSYDSPATAFAKGQYILNANLGGGMVFSLDCDSFFDTEEPYGVTQGLAKGLGR